MANWHDLVGYSSDCLFPFDLGSGSCDLRTCPGAPNSSADGAGWLPTSFGICFGGWILFTVIGTETWYRST